MKNGFYKYSLLICFFLVSFMAKGEIKHVVSFTDDIQLSEIEMEDGNIYYHVGDSTYDRMENVGFPSLPVRYVRLVVPAGVDISRLKINQAINKESRSLSYKIEPTQEPIATSLAPQIHEFVNTDKYDELSVYPENVAEVVDKGIFRGVQIVTVAVSPCQYYPSENRLEIFSAVDFTLEYEAATGESAPVKWNSTEEMLQTIGSIVDNKEDISTFYLAAAPSMQSTRSAINTSSQYIIVTSAALASSFQDFMAWKKQKGITIEVVTIESIKSNYSGDLVSGINDDAGKLRQFLSDAYRNGCEYVLLGGDYTIIPIRYGNSISTNIPTDLYFSDFDGNWDANNNDVYGEDSGDDVDFYPEVYIGRLLVTTSSEVANWTKKLLRYEQNPGKGNYAYLLKAFFTQADQMQSQNQANGVLSLMTWVPSANRTVFSEEGGANTSTVPSFPTGKEVIDEFNKCYGFCSFMGHGGPTNVAVATAETNSDAYPKRKVTSLDNGSEGLVGVPETGNGFDNMTNVDYPTIYYSISCETSPFDAYNTPADDYNMGRMYTSVAQGGGPTYLGNTRNGYVSQSYSLFKKFVTVISGGNYNLGQAEGISKSQIANGIYYTFVKYSHNLVGCPETELWTATPSKFSNVAITSSGNNITVNPRVSGVTICVMSANDNGSSYYQVRKNVSSAVFSNVPKPYVVTITKHNYIPYQKNPDNVYVQNETFTGQRTIQGTNIIAGESVTTEKAEGPVIVKNGANVTFDATNETYLESGFSVEKGGQLKVN